MNPLFFNKCKLGLWKRIDFDDGHSAGFGEGDFPLYALRFFPSLELEDEELFAGGEDGQIELHPMLSGKFRDEIHQDFVMSERREDVIVLGGEAGGCVVSGCAPFLLHIHINVAKRAREVN